MTPPLRIDVVDRSAASEISRRLSAFRTRLVRSGVDSWYVAVDADGNPDVVVPEVLETLQTWVAEAGAECVLHHGEGSYPLRANAAF